MLYPITRLMVNICYSPFTSWMNEYVLHFVYGDLKLHCHHKWMTWTFCSNFVILFSSKIYYISGRNIYLQTLKGPASACRVEATHIKKKKRTSILSLSVVHSVTSAFILLPFLIVRSIWIGYQRSLYEIHD